MSQKFPKVRFNRFARIHGGGTPQSNPSYWGGSIPFATPKDLRPVDGKKLLKTERTLTAEGARRGSSIAQPGDVLLSVRAPVGYSVLVETEVAFSQGCKALSLDKSKAFAPFIVYATNAFKSTLESAANGTTFQELSSRGIAESSIPLPDFVTQQQIVQYLDKETAKIDRLIAKQRELISLTETRLKLWRERSFWGEVQTEDPFLNPPAGWKVLRNRHLLEHMDARSETGDEEMLSVSHITGVTPRSMKNVNMFEAESTVGYRLVAKNELVINTMWAWMGALGVSAYEGIVSPAYNVYRFRDLDAVNPMYFDCMYRTDAYVSLMKAHSRGIWESRLRLYPEVFLRLSSLVPPKDVQDRLVAENNERTTEAEKLITRCHKAIELLQERRSALITAAVTGQIEV